MGINEAFKLDTNFGADTVEVNDDFFDGNEELLLQAEEIATKYNKDIEKYISGFGDFGLFGKKSPDETIASIQAIANKRIQEEISNGDDKIEALRIALESLQLSTNTTAYLN